MKSGPERRKARRVSYLCEVECDGSGMRLATRINDLSVTGAFIDSMTSFPAGSTLTMKFRVRSTEVITTAEVRYSMPQIGMGVRFLNLKPEDMEAIRCVVEEAGS
jgi:hypothetical protein